MSACSSRFCSPRSTSIRARARRRLAGAVIRETLAQGGEACRPLLARDGIGNVFVEPALRYLQERGVAIAFGDELVALRFSDRAVAQLDLTSGPVPLAGSDAVILAVPAYVAAAQGARPQDADRVPRHRQRAFPHRSARRHAADARRRQRHLRMDLRASRPHLGDHQRRRAPVRHAARRARRGDLARGRRALPNCRPRCRPGRSCASGGRPSRRRRSRTRCARARARNGTICSWPAIGPRPACRPRSKAPSARAIAPPNSPINVCGRPHDARLPNRSRKQPTTPGAPPRPPRARCWRASRPTATGCSSSKPTPPSRPNTCCCGIIAASRSMPSSSARSPSICAASRARTAAGRSTIVGDFDISASVKAYFALKMIGDSPQAAHMARAREAILARGGAVNSNVFTRVLLSLYGILPWRSVPEMPVEITLLPRWFPFHLTKVSYWARTVLVPLLGVAGAQAARRRTRAASPSTNCSSATRSRPVRRARRRTRAGCGFRCFAGIDAVLRPGVRFIPKRVRARAIDARGRLRERAAQRPGWAGRDLPGHGQFGADVRRARRCGARAAIARDSVERLLVVKDDEAYCQPCVSPVWDTALACQALAGERDAGGGRRRRPRARLAVAAPGARRRRRLEPSSARALRRAAGPFNTPTRIIPISTIPPWR